MIDRQLAEYLTEIDAQYDIITITGPRQAGKTTLCRQFKPELPYVNLEDPEVRLFAKEDPNQFLSQYPQGAILDEIQRTPELPSYLQVIVDDPLRQCQFYLSGSQSFALRNNLSQSLAGRTAILELLPLCYSEIHSAKPKNSLDELLFQGGFPRIYHRKINANRAMADYLAAYVDRDIRQLNMVRDLDQFQKFLSLCAGRIGQLLNLSSISNDLGISQPTAKEWLNLLEASYIVFRLPPFFKNTRKRLVKTPKLYFYDTALACFLLNIEHPSQLVSHPLKGNLFENLVILEQIKKRFNRGKRHNLLFYRDSNGNEVDLIQPLAQGSLPIEIKLAGTFQSNLLKGIEKFRLEEPCPDGERLVYTGRPFVKESTKIVHYHDWFLSDPSQDFG